MQYLLDFINTATDAEITQYLTDNGCAVLKEWDNFDKAFLVEAATAPAQSSILERIIEENAVAIVPHDVVQVDTKHGCHGHNDYPNIEVDTSSKQDWWKNYSYQQPKFDSSSLTLSRLGQSVSVYVMDSGIDDSHPDFVGRKITKLYSVIPGNFTDHAGHGTALASIIVGNTCGITDANLKVVKIFDNQHQTLQSEFLDALDAVINDHVDFTFAILNCSFSIPKNEWIEHKLSLCADEGIYIVAAAGNNNSSIEDVTPASMWQAITVGAYNSELNPCDFTDYTGPAPTGQGTVNHGELDGWAPGQDIYAAMVGGGYEYISGTSAAAAVTSAVLASNLEWYTSENGSRDFYIREMMVSTTANDEHHANSIVFGRYDLLDYNDPKYNLSVNRIATLRDQCFSIKPQPPDEISLIAKYGETQSPIIYSMTHTKSIESLDPLPPNFYLTDWGRLVIKPNEEENPIPADSHYKLYTLRFSRVDHNDESEIITIFVYVVHPNKDPAEIPENDPVIPILLQVNCLSGGLGCALGSTLACVDNCYPTYIYGCCAGYKSPFLKCKCDPG